MNYVRLKMMTIKLNEVKNVESQIVKMKMNEHANKEMKKMFQSFEEAIVLVDQNEKQISIQNQEFDTMMEHLKKLSS